jgi:ribosome-binding factor A
MASESVRVRKVQDQIHKILAPLLQREVRDSEIGLVTLSSIKVTKDLSLADVYVTFLNADENFDPTRSLRKLSDYAAEFRTVLAKAMPIRTVPKLRFKYDNTLEMAHRLDKLIHESKRKNMSAADDVSVDDAS